MEYVFKKINENILKYHLIFHYYLEKYQENILKILLVIQ